ncbi:stage III sporulation protein AG [Lottiidibacillus patelloidae]|uniref:Stage III sporulation protein AG n=1 Tax=Lottiidibacillus patelloidae TaxID=2670334 RepID=A0A263BV94_9BACI|nr:stage III sporulation protein AG [Lottiidibacillus patelloidae]OZM57630.1 stage III sporulation protein AG [Lottiidibacillus patelloidae]
MKDLIFKNGKLHPYFVVVVLIGAGLMIISNMYSTGNDDYINTLNDEPDVAAFGQKSTPTTMADYEDHYENQLREILEEAVGISDVSVMINLDATETKIHEFNMKQQTQNTDETDSQNGKRKVKDVSNDKQVVIIRVGDKEMPVVVKTEKPVVRGVIIVAKGADNIQVKQWIVEAVTRVLNVPAHKVSVLPKK